MTSIEEGPNRPQLKCAPITMKEWSMAKERHPEQTASLWVAAAQRAANRYPPAAGGEELAAKIYFRIYVKDLLPSKEGMGLGSWVAIVVASLQRCSSARPAAAARMRGRWLRRVGSSEDRGG